MFKETSSRRKGIIPTYMMPSSSIQAACIFDDKHISNRLVEWAYFLSEGYEPDPNDEYLHCFPEVYVDEKEYLITIVAIDTNYSYTCETDIDTL